MAGHSVGFWQRHDGPILLYFLVNGITENVALRTGVLTCCRVLILHWTSQRKKRVIIRFHMHLTHHGSNLVRITINEEKV